MTPPCDRRTFLRRLGGVGLCAPVLPLVGCTPPDDAAGRGTGSTGDEADGRISGASGDESVGQGRGPAVLTHPILREGAGGAVHIVAPPPQLPMAYVSRGRMQVFVDYDYRDRAQFMLGAHISVSTGLWRIRLPGDPENRFVVPGDEPREFEELDIAEWDPTMVPTEGDFRILRGTQAPLRIDFECIAVPGGEGWLSGGPWDIRRCDGAGDDACREDLVEVGVGRLQPVRGCADPATEARVLTWVCTD